MASLGFLPNLAEGDTSLNVSSPQSSTFDLFLNLTDSSETSRRPPVDEADELTPKCGNLRRSSKRESSSPKGRTTSDQESRHCAQETAVATAAEDESLTLNPFSCKQEDTDDESTEEDSFFALKLRNQFVLDEQAARWHYFDRGFPDRPIQHKDSMEGGEISAITGDDRSWDESLFSASSLMKKEEIFSKDLLKESFPPPQEQEDQEDASALMNEIGCCTDFFHVDGKTRRHSTRSVHLSSATIDALAQLMMASTMCSQETSENNCSLAETSVSDEGYVEEESIELFLEDDGETVSLVDQDEGQLSDVAKRAASQALRLTEGMPHTMSDNSKGQKKLDDYLNMLEVEDMAIMKSFRKVHGEVHL